jgi:hypothetical protein
VSDNKLIITHLDYNNIEHRKAAANLHIKLLEGSYLSMLGYDFLVNYYYKLLIKSEIINCILCISDKKYVGFAVYTKFPFSFMSIGFKRYFYLFSKYFVRKILTKPSIIILLIKIIKESITRAFLNKKKLISSESEFLSLGVLTEHYREIVRMKKNYKNEKNTNNILSASGLLVTNVINNCKSSGLKNMRLVCKRNNAKVIRLHKSYGAQVVNEKLSSDSMELMYYF